MFAPYHEKLNLEDQYSVPVNAIGSHAPILSLEMNTEFSKRSHDDMGSKETLMYFGTNNRQDICRWNHKILFLSQLLTEELASCGHNDIHDVNNAKSKPETQAATNSCQKLLWAELWVVVCCYPHLEKIQCIYLIQVSLKILTFHKFLTCRTSGLFILF